MDPVTITFPGFKSLIGFKSVLDPPSSNDSVIVFPFNSFDKKFDRRCYSSAMTQGRVNSEDIDQVLTLFELIFPRFPSLSGFLVSYALRFLLPLFVLICFEQNRVFKDSMNVWISLWLYWGIGICCLLFERCQKTNQAKTELERIIKMVQPGYLKRGLRWRVPEELGSWIELVKEYDGNEQLKSLIVKVEQPDEAQENIQGDSLYVPLKEIKE